MQVAQPSLLACGLLCALAFVNVSDASEVGSKTATTHDAKATAEAKVAKLFGSSRAVDLYYTPVEMMGRVGFSAQMAEQRAKYYFRIRCQVTCGSELQELRRRLSTGRQLRGECPRPISTVMHLGGEGGSKVASIFVSANGQCFAIGSAAYFVDKAHSIAVLVNRLHGVFTQGAL